MIQGDKSGLWVISQGPPAATDGDEKNTQQSSAMTSPDNCSEPFMAFPETSTLENAVWWTKLQDAASYPQIWD